ncbi:hypothetical protein EN780_09960 [Mesorhizobium sp. M4B.F.Ca.ET.089.01.1.1]|uniref:hypothetical protein n=1 Tax=Mesorhizobium sp. M4B.F.Ca.ET.089.01.1.1 TaxID=2496662 RepID=UPI000FE35876|nr:hypothetical protein [Mesorhizobium sp. M4B.F.Ca.ET.089.01.1.1]RWX68215.1 hypothetical protein EN780_09960 [Mesorhizobium sp. M4B.F.Ca.ET.089.01.1.1]
MIAGINKAWGVAFRGGLFVLLRNGREFASHESAGILWNTHRHRFGKVDPGAFNRVMAICRDGKNDLLTPSLVSPVGSESNIESPVGYWLKPDQLRRKEGNDVAD